VIYLDSCALVKLIREEDESQALQAWIDERADDVTVTSELARAEVLRVVRRNNHTDQGVLIDAGELAADLVEAAAVLDAVAQVAVDREILDRAGALEAPMVRTLDAIHVATALDLRASDIEFVTYDRRRAAQAREVGFTVLNPS
jgi:predicted nucleic acid-binding protein